MCVLVLAFIALIAPSASLAYDVPVAGSVYYLQTSGPGAAIGVGDWYTTPIGSGGGSGFHYYGIDIPCTWPPATLVHVDIFSPEMHRAGTVIDELRGGADNTVFEIYPVGTAVAPYATPAAGAGSLLQTTYAPVATADNYVRFYTINTAVTGCGTYILRTSTATDDDNGWRLRVGSDNDGDPNNAPPAASDPGIAVSQFYGTFQHSGPNPSCLDLFEYIASAGSTTFHNFDIDGNTSVTYYPPNGPPVTGSVSGNGVWNNGTTARGGDVVPVAANQVGYWRIETCASNNNQFIQEGSTPLGAYFSLPLGSTVTKDDGVTTAQFGGYLQYTITFTNNSIPTGAVAANIVIRDTIPTNTTFDSASVVAPFTGSCSFSSGVVTCNVNENVAAGASGSVLVNVLVDDPAAGTTVVNNATLDYTDTSSPTPFRYPQERASDTDQLPSLKIVKTSANPGDTGDGPQIGDTITYTLTISNPTASTQTGIVVNDPLPAGTSYVAQSTSATGFPAGLSSKTMLDNFSSTSYSRQDGPDNWTGNWIEIGENNGPGSGSVYVTSGELRVGQNDFGSDGVYREANLVIAGGTSCSATLSFDVREVGLDNIFESVSVAISGNGGATFTTLETFDSTAPGVVTPRSYDITAFIATNTRVRFLSNGNLEDEYVEFDDVQVQNTCTVGTGIKDNIPGGANPDLASGVPSTLVQAGDGLTLGPGESSTVTFQVTVTAAGPIENIATTFSNEDPHPAEGRVRDVALTRATLSGLRVSGGVIEFATSSQRGTKGFNLYSAPTRARRAPKWLINDKLIPSPRPESSTPILYRVDAHVSGPYLWIEEIEVGSKAGRMMGPFSVDDRGLARRFERIELKMAGQPTLDHRGSRSIKPPRKTKIRDRDHQNRRHRAYKPRKVSTSGVKIEIATPGTITLSWGDLVNEGLPTQFTRNTRRLRLTNQGTSVPFEANPSGLSFVATGLATDHAAHNVYILSWNGSPEMKAPLSQSETPVLPGHTRIQKNWIYYQAAPQGSDPWLWDLLFSDDAWPAWWDPTQGDFDLPGYLAQGGTVSVRIPLLGRTDGEHHVEATINGALVGEVTFSGANEAVLEGSVSASTLREVGNQLALTYTSSDGPGAGYVYLNFMDLGLTLPPQPGEVGSLSAYDPDLPRLNRADYLIVTHGDFEAQAEQIARLKNSAGRSAVVVDVERAYDRFTAGIPDASAVKALIKEAGRARTVLLIGDDTIDPADNYEQGEQVFMPSALGWDRFSGRVISENLYADRDDDGLPDVAIGRLSVRTAAEADVMVEKIRNAQGLLARNLGRHVIAVDNQGLNDMAFRGEGRRIQGMLDEPAVFADISYGAAEARTALLEGLSAGALTTTWVGHGAPDHWADEWIFGSDDADSLAHTDQATLLLTWACLSSDYRYFYGPSVSEAMMLAPMGGAVASFGPTGLSLPTLQKELYVRLYPKLMAGLSVGEAVRQAKTELLVAWPGEREFLNGWVLLGDPDVFLPR